DLSAKRDTRLELETALQLRRRALRSERDFELTRYELRLRGGVLAHERLEVTPQPASKLALLQWRQLHANTAECPVETCAQERDRLLDAIGFETLGTELLRKTGIEAKERLVRDRATQAHVDLRVNRSRVDHPIDEPHRGAVREPFELRHAERRLASQLLEHERMRQP